MGDEKVRVTSQDDVQEVVFFFYPYIAMFYNMTRLPFYNHWCWLMDRYEMLYSMLNILPA